MLQFVPIAAVSAAEIEALLDRAFGRDRHARTAYRLRERAAPLPDVSFAALDARRLVGSIQLWPVRHLADDGTKTPLVLVGPVAVDPLRQGTGVGRALTALALAELDRGDGAPQMLIGDPEYYGRFGFTAEATARWRLPGPFAPRRLLARGAAPMAAGRIAPIRG